MRYYLFAKCGELRIESLYGRFKVLRNLEVPAKLFKYVLNFLIRWGKVVLLFITPFLAERRKT